MAEPVAAQLSQKASGLCAVCRTVRRLHNGDGRVHLHGPHSNPCPGSNQPPLGNNNNNDPNLPGTTIGASRIETRSASPTNVNTPAAALVQSGDANTNDDATVFHPTLPGPMVKHVPKAARPALGQLLTNIINKILAAPSTIDHWRDLICFAPITLRQLSRGGRKHNTSSAFKKRAENFADELRTNIQSLSSGTGPASTKLSNKKSRNQMLAASVSSKLEDGNVRAAVRILMSDEEPVSPNAQTFDELKAKHPTPSPDRMQMPPASDCPPLQVSEEEIRTRIRSFPAGSSGGPDGLRPQIVTELIAGSEAGNRLLSAITGLINLLLAGTCPTQVQPILFGGNLLALRKPSGGLRPIAIGYFWRRLASKCAANIAMNRAPEYLTPLQVGVGCPGGCEAAVHSARRYLEAMPNNHVLVKLDFSNAFNSVLRDSMLTALANLLPELSAYGLLSYGNPSLLKFGPYLLPSQMGPQQGDPLGPLLFCLPMQPVLQKLKATLTLGYLDDITLGGETKVVAGDVLVLEEGCAGLGLSLNHKKCEVVCKDPAQIANTVLEHFQIIHPQEATLLGAPLSTAGAFETLMSRRMTELHTALSRLPLIHTQDALILLKLSLTHTKLLHMLRCTPCTGHPLLESFDDTMRQGLTMILNLRLSDHQWVQATLPIRDGGLGIRRVSSLASSAFLASAASTRELQSSILLKAGLDLDPHEAEIFAKWSQESQIPTLTSGSLDKQATWDRPIIIREIASLFSSDLGQYHQARLRAVAAEHASDWLHALPISSCGLRLDDETIRIAVGLRLGAVICERHLCPCGEQVQENDFHGLSCKLGPGRLARHSILNDVVYRALVRVGIPSVKEPSGLLRSDGKRPDGMTMIPWQAGRCLVWDVTVADTVAATHLPSTSLSPGAAAEAASVRKHDKYTDLSADYFFLPLAFETLGPISHDALAFIKELGRHLSALSGDKRERSFLFQRISMSLQRFNAIAFQGTFSASDPDQDES